MNVVHVAATLKGGAGIGLQRYHQALLTQGIRSKILLAAAPEGAADSAIATTTWRSASRWLRLTAAVGVPLSPADRYARQVRQLDAANPDHDYELYSLPFSLHRPEDHPCIKEADVVALHWTAGVLHWPRFFQQVDKPVALVLHDQNHYLGGFHYRRDAERNPAYAGLEKEVTALKRACLSGHSITVVANSDWNRDEALQSGFFTAGTPIETVHYPLDISLYCPAHVRETPRAPSSGRPFVLGFACENLRNERKGFADLLATLADLPTAYRQRLRLRSFGNAPPEATLQGRRELAWEHLGFLADDESKRRAYESMDLFVAPSRAEAFGLTALEAQSVGTPVLAPSVGGLAEAVAMPVHVGSAADSPVQFLREGILRAMDDPASLQASAVAGISLARDRHALPKQGAQLASVLSAICR